MKKIFLTTILVTLLLCSACKESDPVTESTTSQAESTTSSESEVQEPTVQQTITLPKVTITNKQAYEYTEDGKTLLVEASADVVSLTGDGFEKAAQTVDTLFGETSYDLSSLAETAKEDYEYSKANGGTYFAPYSNMSTCEIARLDQRVLSLKCMTYDYMGGAHGMWGYWGASIDLTTGAELELIDLAVDSYALIEDCTEYVQKDLAERAEREGLFEGYENYVTENLSNCNWYMDASGIVFIFTPYEIAPYAAGCIEVCVPYTQLAEHMKPEYCGILGDCIALVQQDAPVSFTATDNQKKEVVFKTKRISEYDDFRTTLKVNKEKVVFEDNVSLQKAYLMHNADGKTFLLYTVDWASDDYETYVYDLTGENIIQTGSIWACLNSRCMGADTLSLEFRLDVLGTYLADMEYVLTEDGMLKPMEDIYRIGNVTGRTGITTVKELPVIIQNQAVTLPVGTRLYIVATDNDGVAWFETAGDNGEMQKGLIRYIRDPETYRIYIEGLVEDEYFDMLPYAG